MLGIASLGNLRNVWTVSIQVLLLVFEKDMAVVSLLTSGWATLAEHGSDSSADLDEEDTIDIVRWEGNLLVLRSEGLRKSTFLARPKFRTAPALGTTNRTAFGPK